MILHGPGRGFQEELVASIFGKDQLKIDPGQNILGQMV
jgi:hypothetical protein